MCLCNFRNVNGVRGFSRETLIALAANIESREWRREYNLKHDIPAEHPRASTTDDVECFFSVLRSTVGKDFTLKEVCWSYHCLKLNQYYRFIMAGEKLQKSL